MWFGITQQPIWPVLFCACDFKPVSESRFAYFGTIHSAHLFLWHSRVARWHLLKKKKKEQNTRRAILQTSINSRWNRNSALLLTEVLSSFSVLSYAHPTRTADTSQQKEFVVSLQSFLNAVLGQCSFVTSFSSPGFVQRFCWSAWGISGEANCTPEAGTVGRLDICWVFHLGCSLSIGSLATNLLLQARKGDLCSADCRQS